MILRRKKLKILDLFCGCGGFSHGFQKAGYKIKYGIDIEKKVKDTYEYNHPNTEFILSDIRELQPEDFKDVDIVIGSPPCPEFSTAKTSCEKNPQKGMIFVNLFLKWIKIIKPKFWIGENVPGLQKYIGPGPYFQKVLDAADYGVPQFRKRFFFGKYKVPDITHAATSFTDLYGNKVKKWISVGKALGLNGILSNVRNPFSSKANSPFFKSNRPARCVTTDSHSYRYISKSKLGKFQGYKLLDINKPSPTVSGNHGNSNIIQIRKMFRFLTVEEVAILQSFPNDFKFICSKTAAYTMIGNAVAALMSYSLAKALNKK